MFIYDTTGITAKKSPLTLLHNQFDSLWLPVIVLLLSITFKCILLVPAAVSAPQQTEDWMFSDANLIYTCRKWALVLWQSIAHVQFLCEGFFVFVFFYFRLFVVLFVGLKMHLKNILIWKVDGLNRYQGNVLGDKCSLCHGNVRLIVSSTQKQKSEKMW